jgi:hypothetical protein
MPKTFSFYVGAPSELAAGLRGWDQKVEITFHDDFVWDEKETEDYLREALKELADGYCVTEAERKQEIEAENRMWENCDLK